MPDAERYFRTDLRTPAGVQSGCLLPFASLEAVCCDVYASLPDIAAELLRDGLAAMDCAILVHDEQHNLLLEIPFSDLLTGRAAPPITAARPDHALQTALADLRSRSEAAIARMDRVTAWMARLTDRALTIERRVP